MQSSNFVPPAGVLLQGPSTSFLLPALLYPALLLEPHYITAHLQQPSASSFSRLSLLFELLLPDPLPPGLDDISLLYFRISRTMS